MTTYEQNMLIGDELILPLLRKNDHMQNTKHEDAKEGGSTMDINGWGGACGKCNKQRVQCPNIPCDDEKIS